MTTNTNTVLITGGSSGIGLDAARGFLERGSNVVLNGRDESKLAEAVKHRIINKSDLELLEKTRADVAEIIAVDEFDSEELRAGFTDTEDHKPQAVA